MARRNIVAVTCVLSMLLAPAILVKEEEEDRALSNQTFIDPLSIALFGAWGWVMANPGAAYSAASAVVEGGLFLKEKLYDTPAERKKMLELAEEYEGARNANCILIDTRISVLQTWKEMHDKTMSGGGAANDCTNPRVRNILMSTLAGILEFCNDQEERLIGGKYMRDDIKLVECGQLAEEFLRLRILYKTRYTNTYVDGRSSSSAEEEIRQDDMKDWTLPDNRKNVLENSFPPSLEAMTAKYCQSGAHLLKEGIPMQLGRLYGQKEGLGCPGLTDSARNPFWKPSDDTESLAHWFEVGGLKPLNLPGHMRSLLETRSSSFADLIAGVSVCSIIQSVTLSDLLDGAGWADQLGLLGPSDNGMNLLKDIMQKDTDRRHQLFCMNTKSAAFEAQVRYLTYEAQRVDESVHGGTRNALESISEAIDEAKGAFKKHSEKIEESCSSLHREQREAEKARKQKEEEAEHAEEARSMFGMLGMM